MTSTVQASHLCAAVWPKTPSYNPPIVTSIPPWRPPSIKQTILPERKQHSQRKSSRAMQIFPFRRVLPTNHNDCARFRLARYDQQTAQARRYALPEPKPLTQSAFFYRNVKPRNSRFSRPRHILVDISDCCPLSPIYDTHAHTFDLNDHLNSYG